jgi:hypothetical protein
VRKFAFTSYWANILIIQLLASVLVWFWPYNLPSNMVRKVAIHSIFAVTCEIMNARI